MTELHFYHPGEGQQVIGQADGDVIEGGPTTDFLTGHEGPDIFEFHRGDGADFVIGFEHGVDELEVHSSIRQVSMHDTDQGMEVFYGQFGQSGPDHFLVVDVHELNLSDFTFS